MNEIWRVLKPGGTMEHYCPQAGTEKDFSSPFHLSHWTLAQFEHFKKFTKMSAEVNDSIIHVKHQVIK